MVNSTQNFLRSGGTKVITNKSEIKKVVIKDLRRSTGGGSSGGQSRNTIADLERVAEAAQAKAEAERKAAEQKTRSELANLARDYNKDLRKIQGVSERTDRLKQFQKDRERISGGRPDIVAGGERTTSSVTRDTKTGEIKRTKETIRGPGGSKTTIQKDIGKGTERIDTRGKGGGRTGYSYAKEIKEEPKVKIEEIKTKDIILPKYESKFEQPTMSTRTDLTYRDVRPEKFDVKKTVAEVSDTLKEQVYDPISQSTYEFSERLQTRGTQAVQLIKGKKEMPVMDLDTGTYGMRTVGGVQSTETIERMRKIAGKDVVSKGIGFIAPYAIPYVGGAIYFSDIERATRGDNYDVIKTLKEKPVETSLLLAPLVLFGALRGYGALSKEIILPTKEGFKVTTRYNELFGKRIVIDYGKSTIKSGEGIKILPSKRGTYVKEVKIKQPVVNLKTDPVGLDFGKKVKYPKQQLEQVGSPGKKTEVYKIEEGFLGRIKEKQLYGGVPYKESGRYQDVLSKLSSIEGEKAARQRLRYTAPKIKKQVLEGEIKIKDVIAEGKFKTKLEQPVVDLGGEIKTRGGKTTYDIKEVVRVGKDKFGLEVGTGIQLEKGKNLINLKGVDFEKGLIVSEKLGGGKVGELSFQRLKSVTAKEKIPYDQRRFLDSQTTILVKRIPKEDKIVTSFKGGGKKSSPEYIQSLYAPELKLAPTIKEIPKPKVKPTTQITETIVKDTVIEAPLMVGGRGLKTIPYKGTGLYEVQELQATTRGPIMQPQLDSVGPQLDIVQDIKLDTKQKTDIKIITEPKIKTGTRTMIDTKIDAKVDSKVDTKIDTKIKTKMKMKLITKQKMKTMMDIVTQIRPGEPRPTPPKIPVPKIKVPIITDTMKSKTVKEAEKVLDSFKVFVTKAGKDVELDQFGTLGEAKKALKGELKETLRAGGFVEKGGKKVKINLGFGFRPSKVTPGKVVQLKELRFGTRTETKEAQFFRKQKGGSKFF